MQFSSPCLSRRFNYLATLGDETSSTITISAILYSSLTSLGSTTDRYVDDSFFNAIRCETILDFDPPHSSRCRIDIKLPQLPAMLRSGVLLKLEAQDHHSLAVPYPSHQDKMIAFCLHINSYSHTLVTITYHSMTYVFVEAFVPRDSVDL